MDLTLDQLSYVLTRKFDKLELGVDACLVCPAKGPDENGVYTPIPGAYIIWWNVDSIPKPTTEELDSWWEVLKDQYNSDPTRDDSDMSKYLRSQRNITINTDI